jgi:DNA processing protein
VNVSSEEKAYWVALVQFRSFGAVRMSRLMRHFRSAKRAFEASVSELIEAAIEPEIANRFLQERIHIDPAALMRDLEVHGVQAITREDDIYPPLLKQIYDPPAVLFVRGILPDPNRRHLAVVGSRKASEYGKQVTQEFVTALAQAGVVIVSGLAYGIDAMAHDATLTAGGTTLAILGSGVDHESIYPSPNRALASRILAAGGGLLSEFPLGTHPLKQHFPFRNRVIAGLCHGTLVVEAALKSGSLITARCALESGRDVYAVPGSIYSQTSEGPHNLIKLGATPATSVEDIFGLEKLLPVESTYQPRGEEETALWNRLTTTPIHIDELIRSCQLPPHTVASTLTMLEIKGAVRHHGGSFYTRSH